MSFSVLCKRLEVMLVRDAGGTFGMTLRGGASVDPGKCRPLTVTHIRPGGPADRLVEIADSVTELMMMMMMMIIIIINIFVERHKVVTSEVLAAVGCVC